jgi:hypothetical protein
MRLIAYAVFGILATTALWIWLITKIHYRIGSRHLKIVLLGMVIRKIELADIKRISKRRPKGAAENWRSTLKSSHRILTIQRYSGIRKFVVITPRNRYVFLADLQNAIKRLKPDANVENLVEQSESESEPNPAAT